MEIGEKVLLKADHSIQTIVDKMWSKKCECYFYELDPHPDLVEDEEIEIYRDKIYDYQFDFADTVVTAILCEVDAYGNHTEIARGHGHIIHEGVVGITQAASYALKKIYEKVGGTF